MHINHFQFLLKENISYYSGNNKIYYFKNAETVQTFIYYFVINNIVQYLQ